MLTVKLFSHFTCAKRFTVYYSRQMESLEIQERIAAGNDRRRLEWNLEEMRKAGNKWMESLKDIHDKKLYRHDYDTFEEFCKQKLNIHRRTAYLAIEAQDMRMLLCDESPEIADTIQEMSANSLRAITKVEPSKRAQVIKELSIQTGSVTAAAIKSKIDPLVEKPVQGREIHRCPHCNGEI